MAPGAGAVDDLIEDIAYYLKPFRPEVRNPSRLISTHIFRHDPETGQRLEPLRPEDLAAPSPEIRRRAKRALKGLVSLEKHAEHLPGITTDEYKRICAALKRWATAPDRRTKPENWFSALQAIVLVERLSQKSATTTQGGDTHLISQLIFEIMTGEAPPEKASLLRALKNIKRGMKTQEPAQLSLTTDPPVVTTGD
jgi:hypothetical protein